MTWPLCFLCGVLCAVLGGLAGGQLGDRYVEWYRVSNFEGGSSYVVVFWGLLGGLAGLAMGVVGGRLFGKVSAFSGWGMSLGMVLGMAVLILGLLRWFGDVAPTLLGDRVDLELELRMPKGWVPKNSVKAGPNPVLLTDGVTNFQGGLVEWSGVDQVAEQWTVPVRLGLNSSRPALWVTVELAKQETIRIRLPRLQKLEVANERFSGWLAVEGAQAGGPEYRYRVERRNVQQEERMHASWELRAKATEQKLVALLSKDAPLEQLLRFVTEENIYARPEARVAEELRRRAGEFGRVMSAPNRSMGWRAMELMQELNEIPADCEAPLREMGVELAKDIVAFRKQEKDPDPDLLAAELLKRRYEAWWTMRSRIGIKPGDRESELIHQAAAGSVIQPIQAIAMMSVTAKAGPR